MGLSQQFISELCFSYVNDEELDLMTILSQGSDIKLHPKLVIFALYPYSLLHPIVVAYIC